MGERLTADDLQEGERWLELIGYEELIGQSSGIVVDGVDVAVEGLIHAHSRCREYAVPVFRALEHMGPNHPDFEPHADIARAAIRFYCPDLFEEQ
jgi:hypothetical protein